jgi:hypothetical protein
MEPTTPPGYVTDDELAIRFNYHAPAPAQVPLYEEMRDRALVLALFIRTTTEPSREQSLALTALDEVVFWTNAARARRDS